MVEVASELSKLGYQMHVVCARPNRREAAHLTMTVEGGADIHFYRYVWPKWVAALTYPLIRRLVAKLQPDLVMERYYNFAGAGMLYAHRHGLPALLEVNALMLDPLSSRKRQLDRYGLFNRLKWWAETQCRWANLIVTPLHTTVPPTIDRAKIVELPWGANVARFDPVKIDFDEAERLRAALGLPVRSDQVRVVVFAGSFRHWHGVETLVEAARLWLQNRDRADPELYFLLLGGGPLFEKVQRQVQAAGLENWVRLTGPVNYNEMPNYLSLADCGVAPFDTSRHAPLREAGFFWSPLKIFEYMAMALPTITPDLRPLNEIVRPGLEGFLYPEGDAPALAVTLQTALVGGPENTAHLRQTGTRGARASSGKI